MGTFSYLIIGAGVGHKIGDHLAQFEDTRLICFADLSAERALEAGRTVKERHGSVDCYSGQVNVTQLPAENLVGLCREFDVVISAVPAMYDPIITRACIEAGVHSCNLGAVLEKTREQLEMHETAKKAGSRIITDTGVDPGLMNAWLRALRARFRQPPERMFMFAGGVPQRPVPPINYGEMYAAEGTWHMVFDPVTHVRNGKIEQVCALDTFGTMPTPRIMMESGLAAYSEMETFESSGAALAPWDLQEAGVKDVTAWTMRWPGFERFVRKNNTKTSFMEAFKKLPPTDADHPDILYASVGAEWKNMTASYELVATFDHEHGFSAMQRATGIPAAITAQMTAHGHLAEGVYTADRALYDAGLVSVYLKRVREALPFTYTERAL